MFHIHCVNLLHSRQLLVFLESKVVPLPFSKNMSNYLLCMESTCLNLLNYPVPYFLSPVLALYICAFARDFVIHTISFLSILGVETLLKYASLVGVHPLLSSFCKSSGGCMTSSLNVCLHFTCFLLGTSPCTKTEFQQGDLTHLLPWYSLKISVLLFQ